MTNPNDDTRCDCRSLWCRLDRLLHHRIRTVCDRHDRHILRGS